jgi:hypothetical protein
VRASSLPDRTIRLRVAVMLPVSGLKASEREAGGHRVEGDHDRGAA